MLGTGPPRHCGLILAGVRDFFVLQMSELALGSHPTFIQCVMEAVFMGLKWLICKGDHSPPSLVEVKVTGAVTPLPPHAFMVCTHIDSPLYYIWLVVCCQCISYREPI
jgi:hypothetical protein